MLLKLYALPYGTYMLPVPLFSSSLVCNCLIFYTMEAQPILQSRSPFSSPASWRFRHGKECFLNRVVATVATPLDIREVRRERSSGGYKDNWLSQIAINHLSHNVQATTGWLTSSHSLHHFSYFFLPTPPIFFQHKTNFLWYKQG